MSTSREVVTIQVGNFANFIGTHWWNIQESSFCFSPDSSVPLDINHDVMFREGLNYRGEVTYTPRLVLVDLPDNLTSIRQECPLYRSSEEDNTDALWEGAVEVIKNDTHSIRRNPFLEEFEKASEVAGGDGDLPIDKPQVTTEVDYDFNSPDTVWSDFLKTNLHPKSFCLFNELTSSVDNNPMDLYSYGEEMYIKSGKEHIENALRRMSEECDYLQGFHLIFDGYNAYSSISSQILQYLDDEYKRVPSLCFPVYQDNKETPIEDNEVQMHRLYASLYSFSNLNSYSTFFSPLSFSNDVVKLSPPSKRFPFLQYKDNLLYHTSSILAAAIETLTSPYRLRSMKFNMWDITSAMSTYGRKLVSSSTSLPFPLSDKAFLNSLVEKEKPEYFMTSLTPFHNPESEKTLFQSSVLRGIPVHKFQDLSKSIYHTVQPEEIFGEYLNKYSASSVTTATVFPEMCSVASPFPKIFKDAVGDSGFLNPIDHFSRQGVSKVPVSASFCSSDGAAEFLEDLLSQANKRNFKQYVKCAETTYEKDSYLEVVENLLGLQDNYTNYQ